ncbi:transcriptional regulator [Opitutaceae bacterium TAV1]|nr:transcriptional regulator [Opitutaceae bacterium TAV1]
MKNPSGKRIRQRDIAEVAGVHLTTVCLSLKNHPSIPVATRERIARLAREMGYTPDPMLAALASYRTRMRTPAFQGTLAWLVNAVDDYDWKSNPHYHDYYRGAAEQAKVHGYTLDTFEIRRPDMTPERLASVLRARHINGVLLCPQSKPGTSLEFPWGQVSSVTFGYKLDNPRLHAVTATHYRNTVRVMCELRARGYRRIGFAFSRSHDAGIARNYLAGFLTEQIGYEMRMPEIPPYLESYRGDTGGVMLWIRQYKPDAIVTGEYGAFELLEKAGMEIPGELGVACPTLPNNRTRLAGMVEDCVHIGAVAVDSLVAAIHRGEKGVPAQPVRILVDGTWHEGESLRS